MKAEEFYRLYGSTRQKAKVTVHCELCGKSNTINREKAEENILKNNGCYLDRSCAQKLSHQRNPRGQDTHQKQREGRLGKKHSDETRKKMSEAAVKKWGTDWGIRQKQILSEKTARQHSRTSLDKSKVKLFYKSVKNNTITICASSYEFIACEDFLEKDEFIESYESQIPYSGQERSRSLDFLVVFKDGSKKAIEVKPENRMHEQYNIDQIKDSRLNAEKNGWSFEVWTEKDLGINNPKEATRRADEYRKKHFLLDYEQLRKERARIRAKKHYDSKLKSERIIVYCEYCRSYHTPLSLTYNRNIKKNGHYICLIENGHLTGKLSKKKKENPFKSEGKKQCAKCREILDIGQFSPKAKTGVLCTKCKACRSEEEKERYHRRMRNEQEKEID